MKHEFNDTNVQQRYKIIKVFESTVNTYKSSSSSLLGEAIVTDVSFRHLLQLLSVMFPDIEAGEGTQASLALRTNSDGVLHRLRKLLPKSLGEEDSEDSSPGGNDAHDEDGGWQPDLLEKVEQEAGDPTDPGHQGTGAHRLVSDHCREHLRCVDVDDGETGAGPELANQGQEDLKEHGMLRLL